MNEENRMLANAICLVESAWRGAHDGLSIDRSSTEWTVDQANVFV
jgi:hypothetical protein